MSTIVIFFTDREKLGWQSSDGTMNTTPSITYFAQLSTTDTCGAPYPPRFESCSGYAVRFADEIENNIQSDQCSFAASNIRSLKCDKISVNYK